MTFVTKQFKEDPAGTPIAGLVVRLTDAKTGTPLRYQLAGSVTTLRDEPLVTNDMGLIAVDVFDTDGYEIKVSRPTGELVYQEVVIPGRETVSTVETLDFDRNGETVIVKILAGATSLTFAQNGPAQTFNLMLLRSDGKVTVYADGMSSGAQGTYVVNMSRDDNTGVVTVTPVNNATGTCDLVFSSDTSPEVRIPVTVA